MIWQGGLNGVKKLLCLRGRKVYFFSGYNLLMRWLLGFCVLWYDFHHYYFLVAYIVVNKVSEYFFDELAYNFVVFLFEVFGLVFIIFVLTITLAQDDGFAILNEEFLDDDFLVVATWTVVYQILALLNEFFRSVQFDVWDQIIYRLVIFQAINTLGVQSLPIRSNGLDELCCFLKFLDFICYSVRVNLALLSSWASYVHITEPADILNLLLFLWEIFEFLLK